MAYNHLISVLSLILDALPLIAMCNSGGLGKFRYGTRGSWPLLGIAHLITGTSGPMQQCILGPSQWNAAGSLRILGEDLRLPSHHFRVCQKKKEKKPRRTIKKVLPYVIK